VTTGLASDELAMVSSLVEDQWRARLRVVAPAHADRFERLGIERYHEVAELVEHASVWPKAVRILPAAAVDSIRATSLFERLESEFGPFEVSDEEGLGREEIYWRLVRPQQGSDMGPLHADRWFWELGHGRTPEARQRVKVWVAIVCEPGLSGLRLVRGSHLREWRYHGEMRDGMMKPQIDEDVDSLGAELVRTRPGDAVVFHDGLLHGGAPNRGTLTRVSFEFTMFVRPSAGAR